MLVSGERQPCPPSPVPQLETAGQHLVICLARLTLYGSFCFDLEFIHANLATAPDAGLKLHVRAIGKDWQWLIYNARIEQACLKLRLLDRRTAQENEIEPAISHPPYRMPPYRRT